MEIPTSIPTIGSPHVQELLEILKAHNIPSREDLLAVLGELGKMGDQLTAAVKELTAMRLELAKAKERNHPAKNIMQAAADAVQRRVSSLRYILSQCKRQIISGCRAATAAFREGGIDALADIVKFFRIKPLLETLRDGLARSITADDRAISKIEAASVEYHEVGRHLKNMGRAMRGKDAIQEAKPVGKIAKAFTAPYRAERSCLVTMKRTAEAAIDCISRLENRAAQRISVKEIIQAHRKQTAAEKKAIPAPAHKRSADVERA